MKKQSFIWTTSVLVLLLVAYACKKDDNNTTPQNQTLQVSATLNGQGVHPTATYSTATGNLSGTIDPNSLVMTYTLTYSAGLMPTSAYLYRITNLADNSGIADMALISGLIGGTPTYPGSGTSTNPGRGTLTGPGSGTLTGPGSGTSTDPISGTSTDPGSGTLTGPGSGTSTNPGSGTTTGIGSLMVTSPYSGTVTLTQAKVDSLKNGYYYISIGSSLYPAGEIRGRVRAQ